MHAQLDDLLTATYVLVDDFLPKPRGPGRPPPITDAELITLAIAQVFMGLPNDRQFLALAGYRLSHLFAYLPRQSGCNKRLRALTPQIERAINYLAFCSPGWCDQLRLLDSTPVPCAASREKVRRSEFAGIAAYGYCRSHSRYFWGFRLYLLCASDGTPIAFELAPANAPSERSRARCSSGSRSPASPSSPTRASPAPSSRAGWPIAGPSSFVPISRQAAPRATQAFAETTNGGSGSLSLQSSRNAVRRSGSRPATCAPDGATPSVNGSHQSSNVACSTSTATALSTMSPIPAARKRSA